jgi:hypothetical protein
VNEKQISEAHYRSLALNLAVATMPGQQSAEEVLQTAQKYLAFIVGSQTNQEKPQ